MHVGCRIGSTPIPRSSPIYAWRVTTRRDNSTILTLVAFFIISCLFVRREGSPTFRSMGSLYLGCVSRCTLASGLVDFEPEFLLTISGHSDLRWAVRPLPHVLDMWHKDQYQHPVGRRNDCFLVDHNVCGNNPFCVAGRLRLSYRTKRRWQRKPPYAATSVAVSSWMDTLRCNVCFDAHYSN